MMSTAEMVTCDHGFCAKIKRVVMSRDVYPRKWGLGPKVSTSQPLHIESNVRWSKHVIQHMVFCIKALRKKQLIADGKLGKFGKILETTPAAIQEEFALIPTKVR